MAKESKHYTIFSSHSVPRHCFLDTREESSEDFQKWLRIWKLRSLPIVSIRVQFYVNWTFLFLNGKTKKIGRIPYKIKKDVLILQALSGSPLLSPYIEIQPTKQ